MRKPLEKFPRGLTKEELMNKSAYVYFDNEEEMELFIKRYKLKNFEYLPEPRMIKFPYSELMKEKNND